MDRDHGGSGANPEQGMPARLPKPARVAHCVDGGVAWQPNHRSMSMVCCHPRLRRRGRGRRQSADALRFDLPAVHTRRRFVAMGAVFYIAVTTGGGDPPDGVGKLIGGVAFCVGLIMVVVAGAELFTGNNLLIMALGGPPRANSAAPRTGPSSTSALRSRATALHHEVLGTESHMASNGEVGLNALSIAHAKCQARFHPRLHAWYLLQCPRLLGRLAHHVLPHHRRQDPRHHLPHNRLRRGWLRALGEHVLRAHGVVPGQVRRTRVLAGYWGIAR